jgi:hypothetical protein
MSCWPTSPMKRPPSLRSKEKRNGFRKPNAQISGTAPGLPTNGLSGGIPYRPFAELLPSTSMRSTLPSAFVSDWALPPAT